MLYLSHHTIFTLQLVTGSQRSYIHPHSQTLPSSFPFPFCILSILTHQITTGNKTSMEWYRVIYSLYGKAVKVAFTFSCSLQTVCHQYRRLLNYIKIFRNVLIIGICVKYMYTYKLLYDSNYACKDCTHLLLYKPGAVVHSTMINQSCITMEAMFTFLSCSI